MVVSATRRGDSPRAVQGASVYADHKKSTFHRKHNRRGLHRRDYTRYRDFLRHGLVIFYATLSRLVEEAPPPYRVRDPHTRGHPPADPRDITRFLLIRALEGWSYDHVYAVLTAQADLPKVLGFTKVPHPNTVLGNLDRIPVHYWERLVQRLSLQLAVVFPGPVNTAGDATGEGTQQFQRWYDFRFGRERRWQKFLKLHALVSTRARFPWFLAARVTAGTWNDSPQLEVLLDQVDESIELGLVALDKGYQSRRNAQLIEDRGGTPVMDLKQNVRHPFPRNYPAWKRMVWRWRDKRSFRCRYRRRVVVEGLFGAFKRRFGDRIRSRQRHRQRAEILARVVVWNLLAVVYHRA